MWKEMLQYVKRDATLPFAFSYLLKLVFYFISTLLIPMEEIDLKEEWPKQQDKGHKNWIFLREGWDGEEEFGHLTRLCADQSRMSLVHLGLC